MTDSPTVVVLQYMYLSFKWFALIGWSICDLFSDWRIFGEFLLVRAALSRYLSLSLPDWLAKMLAFSYMEDFFF